MRVTCVMPTRASRREFWVSAIRSFLNQTYQDSELLILNEADDPMPLPVSGRPDRIRYVRIPSASMTTGAKRNLVNSMAEGELIVHWDDDDWYHPARIETQVGFLDDTRQQVVGWHDLLYYRVAERSLWCYYYQGARPYATGVSLCYRKSWWERHPFPADRSIGEDTAFWHDASGAGVMASTGKELGFGNIKFIVARAHDGNTFKVPRTAPWVEATREMFPAEFLAEEGL